MDTEAMFLQVLIDRVEIATDSNVCLFNTKDVWLNKMKMHIDRFHLDNGKLQWLGYDIMTKNNDDYQELICVWKELHNTK